MVHSLSESFCHSEDSAQLEKHEVGATDEHPRSPKEAGEGYQDLKVPSWIYFEDQIYGYDETKVSRVELQLV